MFVFWEISRYQSEEMMIILGIDPGYAIVGWGVIEYERCGIFAFRISDDIGLLRGLMFLFCNKITVCFAAIGAGIIFVKKIFTANTDAKLS